MVATVAVDVGVGESYVIVRVVACPFDDVVIVVNHSGAGGASGVAAAKGRGKRLNILHNSTRKRGARTVCDTSREEGNDSEQGLHRVRW